MPYPCMTVVGEDNTNHGNVPDEWQGLGITLWQLIRGASPSAAIGGPPRTGYLVPITIDSAPLHHAHWCRTSAELQHITWEFTHCSQDMEQRSLPSVVCVFTEHKLVPDLGHLSQMSPLQLLFCLNSQSFLVQTQMSSPTALEVRNLNGWAEVWSFWLQRTFSCLLHLLTKGCRLPWLMGLHPSDLCQSSHWHLTLSPAFLLLTPGDARGPLRESRLLSSHRLSFKCPCKVPFAT